MAKKLWNTASKKNSMTSYYRYWKLQRNSETLKAYLYALYTSTQSHNTWKRLTDTQHIHNSACVCLRVFIMHTTNTNSLSHTLRSTPNTQMQGTRTYSFSHTEKQHTHNSNIQTHTHVDRWTRWQRCTGRRWQRCTAPLNQRSEKRRCR